jgi:hypothetical protein
MFIALTRKLRHSGQPTGRSTYARFIGLALVGPNMGEYSLPITRIMITNAYSGGHSPFGQYVTDVEIWDGFPCGVGVSCYSPR